jgi:predicted oxidoreductase (fatty acid repression mutant protein)
VILWGHPEIKQILFHCLRFRVFLVQKPKYLPLKTGGQTDRRQATFMEKTFWEALEGRRSVYGFGKEKPVAEERIVEIAQKALTLVPSSFNCQSTRMVVLFGEHHKKLWDIVINELRKVTDDRQFAKSQAKVREDFQSGYGTVLFFEDQAVVKGLQEQFALYKDKFPVWSEHTAAMHQFTVWAALAQEGLGASLQHYHPLIDDAVRKEWNIPESWELTAQMPFGKPISAPDEKEHMAISGRLKVFS